MENTDKIVVLKNFKLNVFENLLKQSLKVNEQFMLEISPEIIKSCSFSVTKALMKLWTIPLKNLIAIPTNDDIEQITDKPKEVEIENFETFNFYFLKGSLFLNYLKAHSSDVVDLKFTIREENEKYFAINVDISTKTEEEIKLNTIIPLAEEEMLNNKIDDYSEIIKECTPDKNMVEFVLLDSHIKDIKRLIKNLHKAETTNTSFLNITIDSKQEIINVKDKVFSVDFPLTLENLNELPEEPITFNILKNDFGMIGDHTFSIFVSENNPKVIFGAKYAGSLIWCISSQVDENIKGMDDLDSLNDNIDELSISEYLED